jgi:hypothetical protein
MKKLLRLMVLAGIFSLASWVSPGLVTPLQAASCPGGYPSCTFLGGRACSKSTPCCDGPDQGFCNCAGFHYLCAF